MYNIEIKIYLRQPSQDYFPQFWGYLARFSLDVENVLKRYAISGNIGGFKLYKVLTQIFDTISIEIAASVSYISSSFLANILREDLTKLIAEQLIYIGNPHDVIVNIRNDINDVNIRIAEEPLTTLNLISTMTALTHLHTKCWLISKKRFADVIEYAQGYNPRWAEEAHLLITKLSYNSPADIRLNVNTDISTQGIVEALKIGIDAIAQAPIRREEAKLANQARILELKQKEQETQSTIADKDQSRLITSQKADLEKQEMLLQLEERKIEIEIKRLEIQEKRLEIEKKRIDYAIETATKMVQILSPDADEGTKEMLLRTLLPDLLQLGNSKGLETILPIPDIADETTS